MPVVMVETGAAGGAATKYRIYGDHLGSLRAVVREDGTVVQTMEHDAWGQILPASDVVVVGFERVPFGFAGGLYDEGTGLLRFGAREYDPGTGRWLSKDAARFGGGWNFYEYAGGDPVNWVDRSGRTPIGVAAAVVAAAAGFAAGTWFYFDWMTVDDAAASGLPGQIDGQQDAYRHCLLACRMSKAYGKGVADFVCERHEDADDHSPAAEMDRANNAVGLAYGDWEQLFHDGRIRGLFHAC